MHGTGACGNAEAVWWVVPILFWFWSRVLAD